MEVSSFLFRIAARGADESVFAVGIPAFSLGSRPSSYAGSAASSNVGSDDEESSDEEEKEVRKSGF